VLVIGGFVVYAVYQGKALDASSKAYVMANVPPIVSNWSKQELLKRASPELLKQIGRHPGQIDRMFHKLSALGPMLSLGSVQGESQISYDLPEGKASIAAYVIKAVFANGTVKIKVRLILHDGKWTFLNFYVTAPASLNAPPEEQTV
jgi:hypothetical protein